MQTPPPPPPPPHSHEAEESVIGGILVHPRRLLDVVPILRADDLYHPALRAIYEAMLELNAASKPVDAVTIGEQMRATNTFDKLRAFRGADYLTELMAKVVTVESIGYHAKIVRALATQRRWIEKFRELAAQGYAAGDPEEYFASCQHEMLQLAMDRQSAGAGPKKMAEVMGKYSDTLTMRVKRQMETGSCVTGIPTGYQQLDQVTAGFHATNLVIIASRPAMGKTSFVMNMVVNAARIIDPATRRRKYPALVFSLEMADEELAERAVSGEARVDSQRLRHGEVEPNQWKTITRAIGNLADMPVHIDDRGTLTVDEMRAVATTWRMSLPEGSEPKIVVDYMQLITAHQQRRNATRNDDVSAISRALKQMAMDLKVPVIALSQLSRALESRADKRPMLSDLRDSGAIEQDANVVMFIYRDEVYSKEQCLDKNKGVAEIIVAKQRMGPLNTVRLSFLDSMTKFENLSTRSES